MSERKLGIGIIGCGNIANGAHIPNYIRNPRVSIIAVADVVPEKARATAERWGIPNYYQDYHELLARPDVEAVSVTTSVGNHAAPVIAAAEAGKHIICEKPIARTLEEADAMVAAAERAGVKFTMGYQPRFSTSWQTVKQLLVEGHIGNPQAINVVACGRAAHKNPWFYHKAEAGGGVLMDWGIYTAYQINWLMGPVERVFATSRIFRKQDFTGETFVPDIDVEDTVSATLQFRSGAVGNWYATWAGTTTHGYTSIDGSEGSIIMRAGTGQAVNVFTTRSADPGLLQGWRQLNIQDPPNPELHYRKLAHLVDAVLDDKPLVLTGADGRDALELVQAIYRSAESGQPVDLPLPRH